MEKKQIETAADELLQPGVDRRAEAQRQRLAVVHLQKQKQVSAAFVVVGVLCGALIAYLMGEPFARGALLGALAGAGSGWLFFRAARGKANAKANSR